MSQTGPDGRHRGARTLENTFPARPGRVAVGTAVTRCPPHRPVLALLTHTVPPLDMFGVEAHTGIWVQDTDLRYEDAESGQETCPVPATPLTPPTQLAEPESEHFVPKHVQPFLVARNGMVLEIAPHHGLQPLPRIADRLVHSLSQLRLNLFQLRCHALADGLS